MKKVFIFLFTICILSSCSDNSDSNLDDSQGQEQEQEQEEEEEQNQIYEAPNVRSYATYMAENSVTLNGFIDHSNVVFSEEDYFNVGFILRVGDPNDSSNDVIVELEQSVEFFNGTYTFDHVFESLVTNTTYYYTAFTKNGSSERFDWEEFKTSDIPCTYNQDNYYTISGIGYYISYVQILDNLCCDDGNIGFRFGTYPNIFEVNFNEINSEYPITGQYYGVDYAFDISAYNRDIVKSSNQVLIQYGNSTTETELFVNNDGNRITLIFCDTELRNGNVLNGKVSVLIP